MFIISWHGRPVTVLILVALYGRWKQDRAAFFSQIRQLQARSELDPDEAMDLALGAQRAIRTGSSGRAG